MPGNGFPNSLDAFLGDVVRGEELTGGVRTIDLEALVFARELLDDVKIVGMWWVRKGVQGRNAIFADGPAQPRTGTLEWNG